MNRFHDVPVFNSAENTDDIPYLQIINSNEASLETITKALKENKLLLVKGVNIASSGALFNLLVEHYDLKSSYDIQMQLVVHMMEGRESVDNLAVTVNERDTLQYIQAHSEGDSTSPLELFGLHCEVNAKQGGENILSLVNQSADFSHLLAKEKVIVGENLSQKDIMTLRRAHMDATEVQATMPNNAQVIQQGTKGAVVVGTMPLEPSRSVINDESVYTLWDNVTVHDHGFHRHQFELLKHLDLLKGSDNATYSDYMHVEHDSYWAPADTNSGDVAKTSSLFSCHVVHKMDAGDLLIFNNKTWAHSVNNWPEGEQRKLSAMYA